MLFSEIDLGCNVKNYDVNMKGQEHHEKVELSEKWEGILPCLLFNLC